MRFEKIFFNGYLTLELRSSITGFFNLILTFREIKLERRVLESGKNGTKFSLLYILFL